MEPEGLGALGLVPTKMGIYFANIFSCRYCFNPDNLDAAHQWNQERG